MAKPELLTTFLLYFHSNRVGVQGDIFKSGKFKVAYFESEKYYKLELIPLQKNMKESLKKINMYFDKSVTSVSKLDMIEPNDDYTTLDFNCQ